jgi:homoserine dehydrogenase
VLGDVVAAARNRVSGSSEPGESSYAALPVLRMGAATTAYFVHLRVIDRPGVLARVAGVFAEHGASIRSMTQKGEGDAAELLILTHPGRESDLAATVAGLRSLASVDAVLGVMRVIGEGR